MTAKLPVMVTARPVRPDTTHVSWYGTGYNVEAVGVGANVGADLDADVDGDFDGNSNDFYVHVIQI